MIETETAANRDSMVAVIEAEFMQAGAWLQKDRLGELVRRALLAVPRDAFVPEEMRRYAHQNRPLPIGLGQTISQPFIVAVMTDLAAIGKGDRVLEVGTGCGYQTAILAELGAEVYSVETLEELAISAGQRLAALGYGSVKIRCDDGAKGWREHAPFNAILVTAAAPGEIPPALIEQLAPGGHMVIPVDRGRWRRGAFGRPSQELILVTKSPDGRVDERVVLPVAFVPLVHRR